MFGGVRMKPMLAVLLMIVFSAAAAAHDGDFDEAKQLIESKVPCSELAEGQLEIMGDYYMEQMHPGEAHELMDQMMGGEGSESLKLAHINMAKRLYCNEGFGGMMGTMMGSGYGMMSNGGMMNMMGNYGGNYGYGMMGSSGFFGASLLWILFAAIGAFVFSVIFWWTYNAIVKTKDKKR